VKAAERIADSYYRIADSHRIEDSHMIDDTTATGPTAAATGDSHGIGSMTTARRQQ